MAKLGEAEMREGILEYFDRLAIVHLPTRKDRFRALSQELTRLGIDISGSKVSIPTPPMPEESNGFMSRGVYGNFLSHLEIIESAYRDGLDSIWILEDDAIFSKRFDNQQTAIAQCLRANAWDLFFIGHSGRKGLPIPATGLLRYSGPFIWAHCYAVHRRIMSRLIDFLRATIERESGHPYGGKLYIDAAYFLFRQFNPDVVSVLTSPCLSIQRGCRSSLGSGGRFEKYPGMDPIVHLARVLRDEAWRHGWLRKNGPQDVLSEKFEVRSASAQTWPTRSLPDRT
jgi:glycosyl transferase, family 25